MWGFTSTGGALAPDRSGAGPLARRRHARYLWPARLSALLALCGASLAVTSTALHLIGLALCYGGALSALVIGIAAAAARQRGVFTGLLPALLIGGLPWLEGWLPPPWLNLLQSLAL